MSSMTTELQTQGLHRHQSFTIRDALSNAWHMVSGSKGSYWGAIALYFVLASVFIFVCDLVLVFLQTLMGEAADGIISVTLGFPLPKGSYTADGVWTIIGFFMKECLKGIPFAGVILMGVRRARGEEIRSLMVFDGFKRLVPLIVLTLLMSITIFLGFLFLIIPGIYLLVAYVFAVPLVLDKEMGPWEAMELSRKTITKRWFTYFSTMFVSVIILLASIIPLGLGLIWTFPMLNNLWGFLYIDAFGDTDR